MSTHLQPMLPFTSQRIQRKRDSKRARIEAFFTEKLGEKFASSFLHGEFGPAFRSRVSDINKDQFSGIRILNCTDVKDHSQYWAEQK